jgi:hypothetical protein
MNATPLMPDSRPKAVLQDLIEQHGRLTVLALALTTLLRPARQPVVLSDKQLSNHLRRDVGLMPLGPPQKGWEHYR